MKRLVLIILAMGNVDGLAMENLSGIVNIMVIFLHVEMPAFYQSRILVCECIFSSIAMGN